MWVDPPSAIAHTRSERRDLTAGGATPSLRKRVGINNATRALTAIAQVGSLYCITFSIPFCPLSYKPIADSVQYPPRNRVCNMAAQGALTSVCLVCVCP